MLTEAKNSDETKRFDRELNADPGRPVSHGVGDLFALMRTGKPPRKEDP